MMSLNVMRLIIGQFTQILNRTIQDRIGHKFISYICKQKFQQRTISSKRHSSATRLQVVN